MTNYPRARAVAALVVAFSCGLIFASGFSLTRMSWAQTRLPTANAVSSPSMAPIGDIQDGFAGVVARVKPAVVSIHVTKYAQQQRSGGRGQRSGWYARPSARRGPSARDEAVPAAQ